LVLPTPMASRIHLLLIGGILAIIHEQPGRVFWETK
jgi:hypothetical protein